MKKFTTILLASFLIGSSLASEASASRSSARPWGGRKKETTTVRRSSLPKSLKTGRNNSAFPNGDRIAWQAKRYHGTRYRFGGDSKRKGFDCSGLVRRVFNDLQMKKLPHTSSGLYDMGKPVRLNDLQPGDLVFFKNTYKRGISHVGVYAGDNKFIHAQNRRRGVSMTRLSDPYYQLHYAGARRLY